MSRSVVFPACVAVALVVTGAQAQGPKRAFTPADYYKVTSLSNPAMSPDGKLIAVTVGTVRESENKRHAEIWVVPAAGGAPVRYTSAGFESSNPRFSPDGKYLFFTSSRPGGKGARWALRMDEPGGEAFQPENYPNATSFTADHRVGVWADTAESAAVRDSAKRAADPFATMGTLARPPYGAITKPVDPKRFDGRQITDMSFKSNDRGYVPSRREARRYAASQIWMQGIDGSAKKQLTNSAYSHRDAVISPDGKWVAFVADAELRADSVSEAERDSLAQLPYDAKRDERERNDVDVFVMPAGGGEPKRVAKAAGAERSLAWSPDSKWISFIAAPSRVKSQRLYVVDPAGGTPQNIIGDYQHEPQQYEWMPNGDIEMTAEVGGRTAILAVSPKTKTVRELVGGRRQLRGWSFDEAHGKVAFVATDMTHPTELFIADANGGNERKLTDFNEKLNAEVAFADAERFTYPSVGGLQIEGWLMKPYGFNASKKYPLVLYIHGGPHSAYGEGWFDEFQNLAGAGMMVLFTNPRGSSGYGGDFTYATRGRWGAEDYVDLMKGVDVVAKRADIDSTRMGVTGGSYGGFMTAWIETKTTRFKAAETDRMISDWTYWYGASDAQGLTEFEFYGKPWDNFVMYDSLSPIRHVRKVKTPTLLVQSEEDFRTPMGNAELWYLALKKQGVPAEFVRYPRSTHELSRSGEPWLLVDRLGRLRQWFSYWLIEKPATQVSAKE